MWRIVTTSLLIIGTIILPSSSLAHEPNTINNEHYMHLSPEGYEPQNLTISAGETIIFENTSRVDVWPASNIHPTHDIYPAFDPQRPIVAGQTWPFTFTRPGIWTYHDHLSPTVTGTITVTAKTTLTPDWLLAVGAKLFAALTPRLLPTYQFDPAISPDATTVYTDNDALYSYIRVFGLPQTMQHLHALSSTMGSCHDVAHKTGRLAYAIMGDSAFTNCRAECHSGCYHGATEYFFREHGTANLAANLTTLCTTELNSFFSHQCVHGIGHGLMAWTNYALHDALQACDLLPRGRDSCYTGVFMENVVGSLGQDNEGHVTNFISDDPHYPCNAVAEKYKSTCYFYQTSRMLQLFPNNFHKIADTCAAAPERFHRYCFASLGRDIGGIYPADVNQAIAVCQYIKDPSNRLDCLDGAVQNYFWEPSGQNLALSFCQSLTVWTEKSACYDTIAHRAALVLPSRPDKIQFCRRVATTWQEQCLTVNAS